MGFFIRVKDLLDTCSPPSITYVPVERQVVKVNNVYHYPKPSRARTSPKKQRIANKQKPKQKPKPNKTTKLAVKEEAVICLVGLGHRKTEAKRRVENMCKSKTYQTAEDIVFDSFSFSA